MTSSQGDLHATLDSLLQQIGLELAFVDVAQENGIAGMHEQVQALAAALDSAAQVPEPIRQAVAAARSWLDERSAADARFTEETIASFNEWHPWLGTALAAWAHGQPCAAVPAGWAVAAAAQAAPPAAAAAPAPAKAQAPAPAKAPAIAEADDQFKDQQVDISITAGDDELVQLFCAEAQDLLQDIEQGVLVLETDPSNATTINTLFRAFHTFKGNLGVMKLVVLQQLTHELESLLDAARRGTFQLGRESFDVILAGEDVLKRYVEELSKLLGSPDQKTTIPLPIPKLTAKVRGLLAEGRSAAPAAAPTPPAKPAAPAAAKPQPVAAPSTAAVPAPVATEKVAPAPVKPPQPAVAPAPTPAAVAPVPAAPLSAPLEPVSADSASAAAAPKAQQRSSASTASGIVRVDTLKLDSLIDLVGELVIAQSMVVQNTEVTTVNDGHLSRSLGQLRGITSDLQRTAMSLRMVPIRNTFQKMARLVRDLALQQGKDIQLVLQGEDTELDRTIVEELGDPLIHMIRNSADHGIEPADQRLAKGKAAAGTITLRAFHQGGLIVIEIKDDGRGLNPDRIRAKAIERGLIRDDESLDEESIFELIFAPGFSTAEQVTDLSGRGVGMDVVRRNIEKMRGTVEIQSVVDRGTTFTISLPLTLAIIEGLLVGVGDQRYIVPTLSVRESFRPLPGMVSTVQGRGEMVSVRGRLTPMLRLGRHLNTPSRAVDPTQGIVVVVESGQESRCLFVDELIGKQEVVIKSLGDMFRNQTEFAGAAILGDGRVGLILDINSLVKLKSKNGDTAA
ncbi:MAG: chemotaxis protein CheA [Planctomycetia bacterium]|nr:chemotaxis protein CheA [Planctomycetia bacterium]